MIESPCQLYLGTSDGLYVGKLTADGVDVVASAIRSNAVRGISVHPDNPAKLSLDVVCEGGASIAPLMLGRRV